MSVWVVTLLPNMEESTWWWTFGKVFTAGRFLAVPSLTTDVSPPPGLAFFYTVSTRKKQFIKQFEVLRSLNNRLTNYEIMNYAQAQIFKYLNINKMTLKYYLYSYLCHFPSANILGYSFIDFWTTKYI